MLLMVEKSISGGIYHSIYQYTKANNNNNNKKHMKDYYENKEASYLQHWNVNNLYGLAILHKLPVNNFKWIKDTSQFTEDSIKNYNEEGDEGYFFEIDAKYLEKLHEFHNDLLFLPERMKIGKLDRLIANLHDKTESAILQKKN